MSTVQENNSSYAKFHFRNSGRISICHSTPPSERDGLITEHNQAKKGNIDMKLPAIVVDGEDGDFNELTEREILYDCSHLNPTNTLDAAVAQNNSELLKKILTSTATVSLDGLNATGGSPIHEAAFQGKLGCLRVFIKFGADVNLRDKEGWTPLHAAICGGDPASVLMLLRGGADVNLAANDGVRPLEMASQCGDEQILDLVSNNGKNEFKEKEGKAPLACEENFGSNILDYV